MEVVSKVVAVSRGVDRCSENGIIFTVTMAAPTTNDNDLLRALSLFPPAALSSDTSCHALVSSSKHVSARCGQRHECEMTGDFFVAHDTTIEYGPRICCVDLRAMGATLGESCPAGLVDGAPVVEFAC